jgi:predicted PurR-regulated permease PerM
MRGQLALSFIIGGAAYLGLSILSVPYALPLAILAGIMEVVPVIGPIVSAIPAILIAYLISPFLALMVALIYFVIQQLENHLIVPQVMNKAVGLNPLVVILAIAIGGRLLGISGALLAVPITVVIQIITEDILNNEEF